MNLEEESDECGVTRPSLGFCENLAAEGAFGTFFLARLYRSRHCGKLNHGSVLLLL